MTSLRVWLARRLLKGLPFYIVPREVGDAAYRMLQAEEVAMHLSMQARIIIEPSGQIRMKPETRQ